MTMNETKSVQWHTEYDINAPPPKPDERFVRFVVLSDTHSTEPDVPDGDVLLHSGDLTDLGGTEAFRKQLRWLATLPHKHTFIIGGNHDYGLCDEDGWYAKRGKTLHERHGYAPADPAAVREAIDEWQRSGSEGFVRRYVKDERVEFDVGGRTWSLFGSPWSPEFGGWAWNYKRGKEAKDLYANLPSTDILLTHTPPHKLGRLDVIKDGKTSVGCEELTEKLESGAIRPLLHCFGHIHEARGTHLQRWETNSSVGDSETLLVNAALVEMNMTSLMAQAAMKMPVIAAARLAGISRSEWLKINLNYAIKFQPIIVDIDPLAVRKPLSHEQDPSKL